MGFPFVSPFHDFITTKTPFRPGALEVAELLGELSDDSDEAAEEPVKAVDVEEEVEEEEEEEEAGRPRGFT